MIRSIPAMHTIVMKQVLPASLSIVALAANAFAQAPRQPGPEEARLGYFTGRWTNEGEGRRGKFTENVSCDWFAGGFHIVCKTDVTSSAGVTTGQFVMSYDWLEKTYTHFEIDSRGMVVFARGSVSGNVWAWETPEVTLDGRRMKQRMIVTEESPTAYLIRFETSVEGGPWVVTTESRAAKRQQAVGQHSQRQL